MDKVGFLAFSGPFNLMIWRKFSMLISGNIIPFHQIFNCISVKLPRLPERFDSLFSFNVFYTEKILIGHCLSLYRPLYIQLI
jgi:hypothetical protein